MLVWVASQSALVIGLLCFAWSYLMCAAIYGAVRFAARRGHEAAFKTASPVTLTPLAVIFGLLVGFLAADVWPNFERARNTVGQEALGLRQALLFADASYAFSQNSLLNVPGSVRLSTIMSAGRLPAPSMSARK